jgi:hypothetical protein
MNNINNQAWRRVINIIEIINESNNGVMAAKQ